VNLNQSRRDGRDLALYGGQVRGRIDLFPSIFAYVIRFEPVLFGDTIDLTSSVLRTSVTTSGFVHYSGHCYRSAQTITTQVIISRDLLVAGANLGMTTATNNAINRDGTLSSGFNLID